MKKPLPAERRQAPRVEKGLSLQLTSRDFDLTTETKNVSARGVYCRIKCHIPFMTKLKVALLVPVQQGRRTVLHPVRGDARVVRSESQIIQNGQERHFVALYFEKMKPSDRLCLERYVQAALARPLVSQR